MTAFDLSKFLFFQRTGSARPWVSLRQPGGWTSITGNQVEHYCHLNDTPGQAYFERHPCAKIHGGRRKWPSGGSEVIGGIAHPSNLGLRRTDVPSLLPRAFLAHQMGKSRINAGGPKPSGECRDLREPAPAAEHRRGNSPLRAARWHEWRLGRGSTRLCFGPRPGSSHRRQ